MLDAITPESVVSISIEALVASVAAVIAATGVFWSLKRSEMDLKRRVESLEKRVGKLSSSEKSRYHRELADGIVTPRDRSPNDSLL